MIFLTKSFIIALAFSQKEKSSTVSVQYHLPIIFYSKISQTNPPDTLSGAKGLFSKLKLCFN